MISIDFIDFNEFQWIQSRIPGAGDQELNCGPPASEPGAVPFLDFNEFHDFNGFEWISLISMNFCTGGCMPKSW